MDYIRMQHLGPGWPTGKWIMIIWRLEQLRHTQAHRLISDQLVAIHHIMMAAPTTLLYYKGEGGLF